MARDNEISRTYSGPSDKKNGVPDSYRCTIKKSVKIQQDGLGIIECVCGETLTGIRYGAECIYKCRCGTSYTSTGWVVA